MIITCTKRLEFDAAHRIPKHINQCKMLHGHRYAVEATFTTINDDNNGGNHNLDKMGMVVDFGIIKERLGGWINDNWDHNVILSNEDKKLGDKISEYTGQNIFYIEKYPTAEIMAKYLFDTVCTKLFNISQDRIKCTKIKLYETPTSYAEISE